MQALGQVQQVGQAAFAVGARQQPLADLLGQPPLPQHRAHAALLPQLPVVAVALHGRGGGCFVVGQGQQLAGLATQQRRGQGGAQNRFARGFEHAAQHLFELSRVGAGEDAGLAVLHAAHAQRGQGAAGHAALAVAAHQHGDIPGLQGAAVQRDLAVQPAAQQAGDFAGAGVCRGLHGVCLGQRCAGGAGGQRP